MKIEHTFTIKKTIWPDPDIIMNEARKISREYMVKTRPGVSYNVQFEHVGVNNVNNREEYYFEFAIYILGD
jgi:hypothetical protein